MEQKYGNHTFMKVCLIIMATLLSACQDRKSTEDTQSSIKNTQKNTGSMKIAIFAGGCFWCTESDFEKVPGVISAVSGYIGGHVNNPTYGQVSDGKTGHTEAVRIEFDPGKISYQQLLQLYWKSIDPTVKDRQFCDIGNQYRSAIFYLDNNQKILAVKSLVKINQALGKPIHTQIEKASTFFPAEEYHQDYYRKNPIRYKYYRLNCGRDRRLKEIWGGKKL